MLELIMAKHFLALLAIFFAFGANAETWRTIHTTRFGATAEVPASWVMDPPPENDDGRSFWSPNGRAEIIVSGIFALGETIADKMASEPEIGQTITYIKRGPGWIVISGTKGERIFYEKSILTCHDKIWNDLWIEYPEAEKHNYDALVTHVSATLHAAKGDQCD
jgi:hypothetical protein